MNSVIVVTDRGKLIRGKPAIREEANGVWFEFERLLHCRSGIERFRRIPRGKDPVGDGIYIGFGGQQKSWGGRHRLVR